MLAEHIRNARSSSVSAMPEKGTLLAINRPSRLTSLIVYFNGYGKDNRPGDIRTRPLRRSCRIFPT